MAEQEEASLHLSLNIDHMCACVCVLGSDRLVGVVEQLKRRLELLRDENTQLESMLHAADSKVAGVAPL